MSWRWIVEAVPYSARCEQCGKPLRLDSQLVEHGGRRYHLPCFLDFVCAALDAKEVPAWLGMIAQ